MMTIYAATKNKHKLEEINSILNDAGITALPYPDMADIEESGSSFEENASVKSDFLSGLLPDDFVIADDSGLEVAALNGAPGIYSARYAGCHGDDKANNEKLLRDMEGVSERSCRYVCVIALSKKGKTLKTFRGIMEGSVGFEEKGCRGFGYDPLFILQDGRSAAELTSEEKNAVSHRRKALEQLKEYLLSNSFRV